jgi:hypothetical protein
MKRVLSSAVALLFLSGVVTCGFAQDQKPAETKAPESSATQPKAVKSTLETIKGKIVSIDAAKNEVVIKSSKTGMEKKLIVGQNVIATLSVGEMVKAKFKPGSSTADSIREYKETTKTKPKKS